MNVIGISAHYHDSAAAILAQGRLLAAAEEERFSRKKHDGSLPWRAANSCLEIAGMTLADIDCLAYYEEPMLKLDRQLAMLKSETRDDVAREIIRRLDAQKAYRDLREGLGYDGLVRTVPHHVSHAASSFFFSGFRDSAVLVLDAVGEWATTSYGSATRENGIHIREQVCFPHSLGLLYSTVTAYLGFEVNEGEYKVMGLAPFGEPTFRDRLRDVIDPGARGAFRLNLEYFDFVGLGRMWSDALVRLLGRPPRSSGEPLEQWHADLAASVQTVLEEIILDKAMYLREELESKNLCIAGGVALNSVVNAKLRASGIFEDIFIQPAAGDAGGAVGAAAVVSHDLHEPPPLERLEHVYLGPSFSADTDILPPLTASGIDFADHRGNLPALLDDVAGRLARQQIVGWFHGRMEFGPRALGARSIIADPRDPHMRDRINKVIKHRESFRPFAPAVLTDAAPDYFEVTGPLPFMLETARVRVDSLPAITHVDRSARVQTVNPRTSPRFAALLKRFSVATGCPVLLNTSFNLRGEPIVCSPLDALACFLRSNLDALVLEDIVIDAKDVPSAWRTRSRVAPLTRENGESDRELAVYELL